MSEVRRPGPSAPVVRPARPADAAAIARVHVEAWRETYAGIVPEGYLASLSYPRREEWWRGILTDPPQGSAAFVGEMDGEVVGFASGGREREGVPGYEGELYAIYVLQRWQRLGLGRRLMQAVTVALLQGELTSMLVWVLADNPGARRFYEVMGGRLVKEKPIEIGGVTLVEVAYGWPDIHPLARPA